MKLETDRLIITKGTLDDYKKVLEYNRKVLEKINKDIEPLDFIIYLKDKTPIGNIKADRIDKKNNSIELSYNIHPNYWGNGYCPEATIEFMDYLYDNGFDNIVVSYASGNNKSKRVVEKVGFTPYKEEDIGGIIKNIKCIMSKNEYYNKYIDNACKKK